MIAFAIPILVSLRQTARGGWPVCLLMAFLLVCGLLSHGGSLFALLGIVLFMATRFLRVMIRETCLVAAMAMLLYTPWIAYQKFVDPPGDRLLKYHFAGVEEPTKVPALQTIYAAYRKQSFGGWWAAKEANIGVLVNHEGEYLRDLARFSDPNSKHHIRVLEFFFLVPSLGFAGFGIAALAVRWTKRPVTNEQLAAERLLQCAACMTVPWVLLMFAPSSTVLHQGTYVLVLFALAGCLLAIREVAACLAVATCIAQCVLNWLVYESDLGVLAFPNALARARNSWMLALNLVSLCGFVALLWWRGRRDTSV